MVASLLEAKLHSSLWERDNQGKIIMRKSSSGTLSFGIMGIGVAFYKAATERKVKFRTLTKDGQPVKRQYVGGSGGEAVEDKNTLKGFEIVKGHHKTGAGAQFVTFTQEEIKALEESSDKSVKIRTFVPLETIDPSYFAETYYLGPDPGYEGQYALFATALQQSGYAAVSSWVNRGKEYAVLVRADDDEGRPGLKLHIMWNQSEINEFTKNWVRIEPDQEEVDMVKTLIERRAVDEFDPSKELRDRYAEKVMAEVEKKKKDSKYKVAVNASGTAAAPAADNKAMLKQMLMDSAKDDAKKAAAPKATAKKKAAKKRKAG
jgi:DNA end-binding protein Ku